MSPKKSLGEIGKATRFRKKVPPPDTSPLIGPGSQARRAAKAMGKPQPAEDPFTVIPKGPVGDAIKGADAMRPSADLSPPALDLNAPRRWGKAPLRSEIRQDAAALFHHVLTPILGMSVQRTLKKLVDDPNFTLDVKQMAAVNQVAQMYAQVGVGMLGTNQIDPADVAQLPPLVIQTADPNAPLPDGKPDA